MNDYKYLGEYINDKGTETTTVDTRISEAVGVGNEILVAASSKKLKHRRTEIGGHAWIASYYIMQKLGLQLKILTLRNWKQSKLRSSRD